LLQDFKTNSVDLDDRGFVIDCNQTYVLPLLESLHLPDGLCGFTNPKSSTGRLDILARVITDRGHSFDVIPAGYSGPLYIELISRSFPIRIRPGDTLAQLRIFRGNEVAIPDDELRAIIDRQGLIRDRGGLPVRSRELEFADGVVLSVDLGRGAKRDATVGYRSRTCTPVLDLQSRGLSIREYWERIYAPTRRSEHFILDPHAFYIFASRERVMVPPELCAEMVAIDVRSGEVRMHYAGFFDSGFGLSDSKGETAGAHIVLEVRNMDVPFHVQDRQRLFRVRFFRNSDTPTQLYGRAIASNYQGQGLRLAKQFKKDRGQESQLEIPWSLPTVAKKTRR
jgi:dCTP deaminase